MEKRMVKYGETFDSPDTAVNYLKLKLADKENEVFSVLFLNNNSQLIEYDEMFNGSINRNTIHFREIAKKALALNAASIIVAHNHPSGNLKASEPDIRLTKTLKEGAALLDIAFLDHLIVTKDGFSSIADLGLI